MLPILTYHSIDESGSVVSVGPQAFADQIAALADLGVRGISLRDALDYRAAHGMWPERAAVLTFDDGFANFYETAMPVLARRGFTATVFVVSGHIGGRNNWAPPPAGLGWCSMLTWRQVKELAVLGIEIGGHTRTHPDLRRLTGKQLDEEIGGASADISARLGRPVESFAYPFGYLSRSIVAAARQSFRAACTTKLCRAGNESLHLLPRVDMYYLRSPMQLQSLMTGQLDRYLSVRRWGRTVRQALRAG